MKFKERLLQGILIKRYKRFFVDIKYKNKIITAHCPNTGSMMGLLSKGNTTWFSKSNDPKRKLKYSLEIIKSENSLVGINTLLTNKLVFEALNLKRIKSLIKFDNIKTEVKFSNDTRFDFLISNNIKKCFLEVKNVTLVRKNGIAEFPDSVTARGKKHLKNLIIANKKGYQSYMIYVVQREDCKLFKIAEDIDKEYKTTLDEAVKNGVNILCYDCKLSSEEIRINNQINYEN